MRRRTLLVGLATLPLVAACASGKSGSGSGSGTGTGSAAEINARSGIYKGAEQDISGTLIKSDQFQQFRHAAARTGLLKTLSSPGPYTLFAPTDEAFAALRKQDLREIMGDDKLLARVLKYHVVEGRILERNLGKTASLKTLEGHSLTVARSGNRLSVDKAGLSFPNIETSNGMIHGIDTVLMPPR